MAPDPTPPPAPSLGDLPTVGYEGGDPPRRPPTATGLADDGDDAPEVPGYEVVRPLGRGGMGVVYLARQVSLNRPVALKLLPVGRLGELGRKRFQAEAESAARVAHPGIVQVYEIGEHAGRPYFALEYCPGGSLADKLGGTPLPPRRAAELVAAVARAVEAAHAAGVVHRDLKPDNVLFAADGTPKVADFGLAKPVQADSQLTHDGAILGTPSYMAPEQARGDSKAVGPAADGYALGAVLYECLTGRPPFRAATLMETLSQVLSADPVPPRKLQPGVPKDLDTIALKCLAKDPAKRYPTAAAVADDLRAFLDGRPITARPLGVRGRFQRWAKRNPAVTGLIGLSCGLLTAGVMTVAAKNAALRTERDAARAAERAAEAARLDADAGRAEADAQRKRADDRLAAAVAAVEGMAALADGEAWVLDADLQAERRKLLATAVAFYERLGEADPADPVVRREAAKAYYRAGRVWLGLGEGARAVAALERAVRLGDGADAHLALGHARAMDAQFAESLAAYTAGVDRAEAAWAKAAHPADALTLAAGLSALARYWSFQNPPRAAEYARRVLALAEQLNPAPDAPPAHRLALAEALVLAGDGDLQAGRVPAAAARYERAEAVFRGLPAHAPDGAVEAYYRLKATIPVQRAAVRVRTAATPDDWRAVADLVRDGLKPADALLAVNPNGFPYLVLKHQALLVLAPACNRLGDAAGRDRADADRRRVAAGLAAHPSGKYVLAGGAFRDSALLIGRVKAGQPDGFDAAAAELLERAGWSPPMDQLVRYNVACGHAQLARLGPEADRERHAAAAVRLLDGLAGTPYFKTPARARELATDADLDPVRGRADFKAVQAKAAGPPAPAAPGA